MPLESPEPGKKLQSPPVQRKGSTSNDNGVGPTYTVKENSFDFSEKFPKSGNYYFKVRAVDIKSNMGDWEESPWIEVFKENILSWKGEWKAMIPAGGI